MRKNVNKNFDARFIPALASLLSIYTSVHGSTTCVSAKYEVTGSFDCPLCAVAKVVANDDSDHYGSCKVCPWVIKTGHNCEGINPYDIYGGHSTSYRRMTAQQRTKQIIEWLKEY